MKKYVVVAALVVQTEDGQKDHVEKAVRGLLRQMIEHDEPPYQVIDFGIDGTLTSKEWEEVKKRAAIWND